MPALKSPRHVMARTALFDKFHHIAITRQPYELAQLEEVGIYASQFNLEDEENLSRYFLPASPEKLASLADTRPEIRPGLTSGDWWEDSSAFGQSDIIQRVMRDQTSNFEAMANGWPCMLDSTQWKARDSLGKFERHLFEGECPTYDGGWSLSATFHISDHSHPHVMGSINHGVIDGESLVRAELLSAMGMIIDQMNFEWSQSYLIFPVLILSFSQGKGRIIQANFDGSAFHIHHSRWYSFIGMDQDIVDLFVRWQVNEPIGDTAMVATMDDTNPGAIGKSPSKSRAYPQRTGVSVIG